MCGIAGQFKFAADGRVDENVIVRMRDAMSHRGPDDEGLWLSPCHRVGLGHRRLSIIDLSPLAAQPMSNEDGTVWVTFNGEIYNHRALRQELEARGHRFRTDHSDTEVLVHGYEEWGAIELGRRLEGDFAFAIWDQPRECLTLLRDHIGVKPVYFSLTHGTFSFASEIKALLLAGELNRRVNFGALGHYLSFLTTPAPQTLFEGVWKLPAGYCLRVSCSGPMEAVRYWDAVPGFSGLTLAGMSESAAEDLLVKETRRRLNDAVARRMMSDVPFGVFLSGGIDSSTNLALMSELSDTPIQTFTVGFRDEPAMNELRHARQAAERWRAEYHEVLIDEDDMFEYLDELVVTQDEPLADWVCIPLFYVSRLARENGVRVVQVGEGADEQFIGYHHYLKYLDVQRYFWEPFSRLPQVVKKGASQGMRAVGDRFVAAQKASEFVSRAASGKELFWSGATIYGDEDKRRLLGQPAPSSQSHEIMRLFGAGSVTGDTHSVVAAIYKSFDDSSPNAGFFQRLIYSELKLRLPELLLMRVDKITMSQSLEARVPFLDRRLVELTMDIPDRFRLRGRTLKYLLKRAVADLLPAEILERPKVGFDAPMPRWLRSKFGQHAEQTILRSFLVREGIIKADYVSELFRLHRSGRNKAMPIWVLFNVCAWHQKWFGA